MLIPGGPGFAEGVTLSIINSETWSGKPEPGIVTIFKHESVLKVLVYILS